MQTDFPLVCTFVGFSQFRMQLSEQEHVRREKLTSLRALNINPYPAALYPVSHDSEQIKKDFVEGLSVVTAGRLMSRRIQGKASFAELQDSKGRIQVYFNRDEICPDEDKTKYNEVYKKLLDIGDIIGVQGILFTTQVGEKTILVKDFSLLSKALRPLPLPKQDADGKLHDEFNDPELRYRQRYVDLIVNPKVKETFIKRTRIIQSMREYLNSKGYLEVDTPVLQPIPGGATARPFITHHNALDIPLYLRIANELYLKRLIVGGFEGVYEFSRDFRNEGMDRTHNPEFTIMELYVAYKDYFWMMETTEVLLEKVVKDLHQGFTKVKLGSSEIDFKAPYPRVPILQAIKEHTGYDLHGKDENQLREIAANLGLEIDERIGSGKIIDEIFSEKCEKKYQQPTFIIDYPKSMSPLTKEHRSNKDLTERFELIVAGKEIANAYSELNDPIDQRERFEEQLRLSEKGDDEAMFIDQDFLRALEYGMPPTSGIGIGIDRLVMLLTDNASIQEVLLFPQMRPEKGAQNETVREHSEELKVTELSEEAQFIFGLLQPQEVLPLQELKTKAGLSNKKWDKGVKELTKRQLIHVNKVDDVLMVFISNK